MKTVRKAAAALAVLVALLALNACEDTGMLTELKQDVAAATTTETVATPLITPATGSFSVDQTVSITSATTGAEIHFTTDGSAAMANSPVYSKPLEVTGDGTVEIIHAIATKVGLRDSDAAESIVTINYQQVATPTASVSTGSYSSDQSVTLSTSTSGAEIRYTLDGTAAKAESPLYSTPLSVSGNGTVKVLHAVALKAGMVASAALEVIITINYAQVSTPQFLPVAGSYQGVQSVGISADAGATVRYTSDGTSPTAAAGTIYTSAVSLPNSATLKAIAFQTGKADSTVAIAAYKVFPNAPGAPSVESPTSFSLAVRWSAPSSPPTLTGYEVYRDTVSSGSFATLAYSGSATNFTDTGLSPSTTYFYKVRAVNADGASTLSASASATTLSAQTGNATTDFRFTQAIYSAFPADAVGVFSGTTITVHVPNGTNKASLKPTFTLSAAASATLGGGSVITSGVTAVDFTSPVTFRVTSQSGASQDYTVSVIVDPLKVIQVTTTELYSMFLMDNGDLYLSGALNQNGNVGIGWSSTNGGNVLAPSYPEPHTSYQLPSRIALGVGSLASGHGYTMVLKKDGTLFAFGENTCGQLGLGTLNDATTLTKVTFFPTLSGGTTVSKVWAGAWQTFVLDSSGKLWAFGYDGSWQLGDAPPNQSAGNGSTYRTMTPVQITTTGSTPMLPLGSETVAGIFPAEYNTFLLTSANTLWAVGQNGAGQLGVGLDSNSQQVVDHYNWVNVTNDSGRSFVSVAAGRRYTLAVDTSGNLYGAGSNMSLELGKSSLNSPSYPSFQSLGLNNCLKVLNGNGYGLSFVNLVIRSNSIWENAENFNWREVQSQVIQWDPANSITGSNPTSIPGTGVVSLATGYGTVGSDYADTVLMAKSDGTLWAATSLRAANNSIARANQWAQTGVDPNPTITHYGTDQWGGSIDYGDPWIGLTASQQFTNNGHNFRLDKLDMALLSDSNAVPFAPPFTQVKWGPLF